MTNPILSTDSYKQSHFKQYPPEARHISAYIEARPNSFSDTVLFFGLQAFLKNMIARPVTVDDVEEAELICASHGVPFHAAGWRKIVDTHDGYLPLKIRALPEGMIVPCGTPMVEVENTDPEMPWLTTFVETALLRSVWYPSTVATLSNLCREIIYSGLLKTSEDPDGQIPFKLHDFGARGVSSAESAALGGMAHLVNFAGTDTMEAVMAARQYYGADMAGFSIPAAEHSTMTSWGPDREAEAYENMLTQFGGKDALVAVVSDSYDLDNAVETIWCQKLKERVLSTEGTLVVRPDSGDPVETPLRVLEKLWSAFGGHTNAKGYRVLIDRVRVIQGDGMTRDTIKELVDRLVTDGWSLDNIAFGMGGGLLQHVNRDTLRFAMKANAMKTVDGHWQDVSKCPATDITKASKAGRQAVVEENGNLIAKRRENVSTDQDLLKTVYEDGTLLIEHTFDDVRKRAQFGGLH
ncbi:MAG: nicotinate phosphoribosyltransferase [Pseudomonadota bacterium]